MVAYLFTHTFFMAGDLEKELTIANTKIRVMKRQADLREQRFYITKKERFLKRIEELYKEVAELQAQIFVLDEALTVINRALN